jgi:hypothetical protein
MHLLRDDDDARQLVMQETGANPFARRRGASPISDAHLQPARPQQDPGSASDGQQDMHLASSTGAAKVRNRQDHEDKVDDAEDASKTARPKPHNRKQVDSQHHWDEAERARQLQAKQKSERKVWC